MPKIFVSDLTLRDGHQSLIATRMRTEDMLPACPMLDRIGFWSLEVWGGATFDSCVRFLKEDPWERLRSLRKALPNTPLMMLLRGQNLLGYRHYSDDVVKAFVKKSADNGVDIFRIFDAMNDLRNVKVSVEAVLASGKHAQGALSYTTSPVHNIEYYVGLAREFEAMGCQSLVIKDMASLLTPLTSFKLVSALKAAVKLPINLHSHSTSGLASVSHFKGVEAGASIIDCCLSAFSEGASHPTTESFVAAFQGSEYDTGLDLALLEEAAAYFRGVRKKYWQFESEFTGVDSRVLVNQVPGGMISNLSNQLKGQGALNRMDEVLAEIPRVRKDLGYPPLVTPTSQIVGTQAVLNVLTGARYKSITNEVKSYLQGGYGKAPGEIDPVIRQAAIGNAKVMTGRPADLLPDEMEKLKGEIDSLAKSEEDVLTYAMFPELARTFLQERAAGTLTPEPLLTREEAGSTAAHMAPNEFSVTLHGETYHIKLTGSGQAGEERRPFYVSVDGVPEEVIIETLSEVQVTGVTNGGAPKPKPAAPTNGGGSSKKRPRPSHPGHVTTAMPGTIVDILVQPGVKVSAGDPVAIIEAMKMENEIQAPVSGMVIAVHIAKGEQVTPDESLLEIQAE